MAYASSEGGYGTGASVFHLDASHSDFISIPDAELLFRGHFGRSGPDLVLTGQDGHHHIIPGYFASEKHPALVAPNGARLSADLVDLLAGSRAPGQYAQAQPTAPADSIGKIEKVVGIVNVVRNGVAVALHVGDAVYKSDVIQTGSDASCGIGFPDGTALSLVANTRMALNDYSFDAGGTSNAALFTLVEGTFAFVAGQVAHTGDGMKIATPVATMGIRGTTGYFATITSNLGQLEYLVSLFEDHNTHHVGRIEIIDDNPNSPTYGQVIDVLTEIGYSHYFMPRVDNTPIIHIELSTSSQLTQELQIINDLFRVLDLINNPNPGNFNSLGSPTLQEFNLPHFTPENGGGNAGQPLTFLLTTPSGAAFTVVVTEEYTTPQHPQTQQTQPSSTTVEWSSPSSGTWETASNWSSNSVPGTPGVPDTVEIEQPIKVTLGTSETVASVVVGTGAILNIVDGGSLVVSGIQNAGLIQLNSSGADPTLAIDGTVLLVGGGELKMLGPTADNLIYGVASTSATLVNVDNTIIGSGTIGQGDGELTLINGFAGIIAASPLLVTDAGILIIDTGNGVNNFGVLEALAGGTLQVDDSVTNLGVLYAAAGGTLQLGNDVDNFGLIQVDSGGTLLVAGVTITGEALSAFVNSGLFEVTGGATLINDVVTNIGGTLQLDPGETLALLGTTIAGGAASVGSAATVDVESSGATFDGVAVTNSGAIDVGETTTATLTLDGGSGVTGGAMSIGGTGTVDVEDSSGATFDGVAVTSSGAIDVGETTTATLTLDGGSGITGGAMSIGGTGIVDVEDSSGATFDGVNVSNSGTIEVGETTTATLTLDGGAGITGGTLSIGSTGTVDVEDSSGATLDGVAVTNLGAIDVGETTTATLTLDGGAGISGGTLSIGSTGTVDVESSGATFDGVAVTSSGTIEVGETTTATLTLDGGATLTGGALSIGGTGIVDVEDSTGATFDGVSVTNDGAIDVGKTTKATLTIDGGTTMTGDGVLLIGHKGTIDVESSLTLDPASLTNHGKLEVTNGATLDVDVNVSGSGSVMIAGGATADFTGTFDENATFVGPGTLELAHTLGGAYGGTITGFGPADAVDLTDLSFSPTETFVWTQATGQLAIFNGATLEETINLAGTYVQADFMLKSGPSDGTEVVYVADEWTNTSGGLWTTASNWSEGVPTSGLNAIIDLPGTYTVTISGAETANSLTITDTAATLTGSGTLTLGALFNQGNVEAGPGDTLTIDPSTIANTGGTIEATGGGTLVLSDTTVTNNGGTIAAHGAGSSVELSDATIAGGTLSTDSLMSVSGGVIEIVPAGGTNVSAFDGSANAVTVDGYVQVEAGANLELIGTIHNEGTIDVDGAQPANLVIDGIGGIVTVDGGGTITLDGSTDSIIGASGGGTLENVNDIISGAGTIGLSGGALTFQNDAGGTVNADLSGQTLFVDTGHTVTNNGLMEATNGGILDVADNVGGSGRVTISGGGVADFAGTFSESVTFAGSGTLELAHTLGGAYGGTIGGFQTGDGIELTDLIYSSNESAVWNSGILTIYDGSILEETIHVSGVFSANSFAIANDGGNAEVVLATEDEWINTSGGLWTTDSDWSNNLPPTSTENAVIDKPGTYTVTISGPVEANSLTISDASATLDGSGTLTAGMIVNHGNIEAGAGETLIIDELGSGSTNYGLIEALDGGSLTINRDASATNEATGIVESLGPGSTLTLYNNLSDANYGTNVAADGGTFIVNVADSGAPGGGNFHTMEAISGGTFEISGDMLNASGAEIESIGRDSVVEFVNANYADDVPTIIDNQGTILAFDHGTVSFDGVGVKNEALAFITSEGPGAHVGISDVFLDNFGTMVAEYGGAICIAATLGVNESTGTMEAVGLGSLLTISDSGINNFGTIAAECGGIVSIDCSTIIGGTLKADGLGSLLTISDSEINNFDTIAAENHGIVSIDCSTIDSGTLQADGGALFVSCDTDLTGTINVDISGGGLADFADVVNASAAVTVTFSGTGFFEHGTLELDQAPSTDGTPITVSGFGTGDTLDLTNLSYTTSGETLSYDSTDHILTVTDQGTSESFTLTGSHSADDFTLVEDPFGGTEVVFGAVDNWIGPSGGNWNNSEDWSTGVPGQLNTAEIEASDITTSGSTVVVTLDGHETVGNLVIGGYGELDIRDGGSLVVLNALDDSGLINVSSISFDPYLQVDGPVRVDSSGEIDAQGRFATVDFFHDEVGNAGGIAAYDGGTVQFDGATVWNEHGAAITADGGTVLFDQATVTNDFCATIAACDGGTIVFSAATVDNDGTIGAKFGGIIDLSYSTITQGCDGVIAADGCGSTVNLDNTTIIGGTLEANCGGVVSIDCSTIIGSTLQADGGALFVSCGSNLVGCINVDISGGGLADFADVVNASAAVTATFSGSGTFELDQAPSTEAGNITISGFGVGDTLDLTNIPYSPGEVTVVSGDVVTLEVPDGGTVESFTLTGGDYTASNFELLSDPQGGTEVVYGTVDTWISESSGNWNCSGDWSNGVPGQLNTAEIVTSGTYVTVEDHETVGNLVIGNGSEGGELDIRDGGSLVVLNALDDSGLINVSSIHTDPYLQVDGPVRVDSGGEIDAQGHFATVDFSHDEVGNAGAIDAYDRGTVNFDGATVTNDYCATIAACDRGTIVFSCATVDNDGTIGAQFGGIIDLSYATITQSCDGVIAADGRGSTVNLDNTTIIGGTLETGWGGLIHAVCGDSTLDDVFVCNFGAIRIDEESGPTTTLTLSGGTDISGGQLSIGCSGILAVESCAGATLDDVFVCNFGAIQVDVESGPTTTLTLSGGTDVSGGQLSIGCSGILAVESCAGATLDDVFVCNFGAIQVDYETSPTTLVLSDGTTVTGGTLSIGLSGLVDIESGLNGSGATLDGVSLTNNGGIDIGDTTAGAVLTLEGYTTTVNVGTINDTGNDSALYVAGNETLDAGTLNIGSTVGTGHLWNDDLTGLGATLTLGSGLTIDQTGTAAINSTYATTAIDDSVVSYATINTAAYDFNIQPDFFTNYGQINADASGGTIEITPTGSFTNYGTVAVSGGETATIENGIVSATQPEDVTNELGGVISVATGSSITVNAGSFTNDGAVEANGGGITINTDVTGTGHLDIGNNGTIELGGTSTNAVTFEGATGTLQIDSTGTSSPFSINGGGVALPAGDVIDLPNISFDAAADSYDASTDVITVSDGHGDTVTIDVVGGIGTGNTFTFSQDASGGTELVDPPAASASATPSVVSSATANGDSGTITFADANPADTFTASVTPESTNAIGSFSLGAVSESNGNASVAWTFDLGNDQLNLAPGQTVTQSYDVQVTDAQDPAQNVNQTVSISIGGPGNDNFVFHPGAGADTIINFNPQADTIALDHFAAIQNTQQLASFITTDAHGDALIELGHNDSIAIPGMTASYLQAHLQSLVHLH